MDITYDEGKALCEAQLGHPANFYNKIQYDEIVEYLRPLIPENEDYVLARKLGAWLGMSFNPVVSIFYEQSKFCVV